MKGFTSTISTIKESYTELMVKLFKSFFTPTPILLLFCCTAVLFALFCPPKHYPDTNYYYGAALLISQGRFLESIEGFYSPLLSWLMAPFIPLGFGVPESFRIVSLLAYIALLLGTRALCRSLGTTTVISTCTLFLTGIHTVYFAVAMPTADLLVGSIFIWVVALLINPRLTHSVKHQLLLGLLAGAAYYAKAIQLPIFILALVMVLGLKLSVARKSTAISVGALGRAGLVCLILCLPWIIALSIKYQTPLISAQQLRVKGQVGIHYSPLDPSSFSPPAPTANGTSVRSFVDQINFRIGRVEAALKYFSEVTGDLFYGQFAWGFYLTILFALLAREVVRYKCQNSHLLILYIVIFAQFAWYLPTGGPYIRYYLPIWPVMELLFFVGLFEFVRLLESLTKRGLVLTSWRARVLGSLLGFIVVAGMIRSTLSTIYSDWQQTDRSVVKYAVSLPLLRDNSGIVTGNSNSPYPGYIAYSLKRFFWASLRADDLGPDLGALLTREQVSQVIWFGEPEVALDTLPEFVRTGPLEFNGQQFWIYTSSS